MTKRLVFGDDSSPSADVAWLWINSHRWPGWQIEVVTAVAGTEAKSDVPEPWQPPSPRELLGTAEETPVFHEVVHCDPREGLRNCCDRDLLVIGPRGNGLLKAMHLGSTSEALMHDPPMPLVIARKGRKTRRVVVCADGSDHSRTAKAALMELPGAAEVEVLVVSVPESHFRAESVANAAARTLTGAVASVDTLVPAPDEMQLFYHPRDIILDVLTSWSADLVVLGTRGLSVWSGLRAGSIASSLAAHAPCSVLLAPASPSR